MKLSGEFYSPILRSVNGLKDHANDYHVSRQNIRSLPWGPTAERKDKAERRRYTSHLSRYSINAANIAEKRAVGLLIDQARREVEFSREQEFRYLRRIQTVLTQVAGEVLDPHDRLRAIAYTDEENEELRRMQEYGDPILEAIDRQRTGQATVWDDAVVLGEYPGFVAIQSMSNQYAYHSNAHALADRVRRENLELVKQNGRNVVEPHEDERDLGSIEHYRTPLHATPGSYTRELDATFELPDLAFTTDRQYRLQLVTRRVCAELPFVGIDSGLLVSSSQYLRIHPEDRDSEPSQDLVL